jgi:mono/diheme cytochrome c family protein
MKRRNVVLLVVVALLCLGGFLVASLLHNGLSARATPTQLEVMMARDARHLAIPSNARATPNPVPDTPENLREARLHFADHCASCHGNDGSGNTLYGRGLYPKPPDLRLKETQKLSDGELFWIIENGVRFTGMPSFYSPGAQNDSWKLVHFIRHLPQLSVEERIEMERYNPKSPDDILEEKQEDDFLNGATPAPPKESHHH